MLCSCTFLIFTCKNVGFICSTSMIYIGIGTSEGTGMPHSYKAKQVIVMRKDLKMRKGKIAAQAGHACVEAVLVALARHHMLESVALSDAQDWIYLKEPLRSSNVASDEEGYGENNALRDWFSCGVAKICVYVNSEEELLHIAQKGDEAGYIYSLIRDAGLTEFHGEPTLTCLAFEPLYPEEIDPITGDLPLY